NPSDACDFPLYLPPPRHRRPDRLAGGPLMQPAELLAELAAGSPLSGVELAASVGVTRAAIWKQIEALRARGVPIEAGGAGGYRLPWPIQLLDAARIRAALPATVAKRLGALEVHWELDSTSSELQRRGAGSRHGAGRNAERRPRPPRSHLAVAAGPEPLPVLPEALRHRLRRAVRAVAGARRDRAAHAGIAGHRRRGPEMAERRAGRRARPRARQ